MSESHRTHPHTGSSFVARRPALATFALVLGITALLDATSVNAQTVGERNGNLTDGDGRTLYTFDKDTTGASHCAGACAFAWPPFVARDGARDNGAFTLVTRADGRRQWARDGKPLYFYVGDVKAGDVRGDNHGGEWHVVKSDAGQASAAQPSTARKTDDHGYYYKP